MIVLAMNPIIHTLGLIGAIIICLFAFIFVLIAVALNLGLAFGMGFLRDKVNLVKTLRPQVDKISHTTEAVLHEEPPPDLEKENALVRTAATVPARVHGVDHKVDETAARVASAVIEFRARTVQAKTMVKAFFLPGLTRRQEPAPASEQGLEFRSPGYRMLMEERESALPPRAVPEPAPAAPENRRSAEQLTDVSAR